MSGVRLEIAIRDGWKQEDNKRFGQCMEIRFIRNSDDKIMFRYAPLLKDKAFWESAFQKLNSYDQLHKQIYSLVMDIDGSYNYTLGECNNEN